MIPLTVHVITLTDVLIKSMLVWWENGPYFAARAASWYGPVWPTTPIPAVSHRNRDSQAHPDRPKGGYHLLIFHSQSFHSESIPFL